MNSHMSKTAEDCLLYSSTLKNCRITYSSSIAGVEHENF